ncbi:zinc metallopeptidase [Aliikangiella sp. IMCC44359]|uniref:zinc metallopeptidase n=1 Tax=Aliikangiella sp. IMCC44359 TaxID=3459125 RepID=UPI00403B21AD
MLIAVIVILVLLLIFGPQLWVKYILAKYNKPLSKMPGTGGELARHLLDSYQLESVLIEQTQDGNDHYDPESNKVRLSPQYFSGKSLTSVAVAAHEVGHAIQFNRNEPVSLLRKRYLGSAHKLQKMGVYCLMALPLIGAVIRIPHAVGLMAIIGVLTMLSSVFIYAAILPEEWDASFNKALPILDKGNYIPKQYLPAIRQILKACALTYVAAALADILKLWRWLALLKMLR